MASRLVRGSVQSHGNGRAQGPWPPTLDELEQLRTTPIPPDSADVARRRGRAQAQKSRLRAIRAAHEDLMKAYEDILSDASLLTHRTRVSVDLRGEAHPPKASRRASGKTLNLLLRKWRKPKRMPRMFRAAVRIVCEGHIIRRLKRLERIYVQLHETLPSDAAFRDGRQWVRDAHENVTRFRQSLPAWSGLRRLCAYVVPSISAVGLVWVSAESWAHVIADLPHTVDEAVDDVFLLLRPVVVMAAIVFAFLTLRVTDWIASVFEAKRDLFHPGWRREEMSWSERQAAAVGPTKLWTDWHRLAEVNRNVYELEQILFATLRRSSQPEARFDLLTRASTALAAGLAALFAGIASTSALLFGVGVTLLFWGAEATAAMARRVWR